MQVSQRISCNIPVNTINDALFRVLDCYDVHANSDSAWSAKRFFTHIAILSKVLRLLLKILLLHPHYLVDVNIPKKPIF